MATPPDRREIDELVRRLREGRYPLSDIREAAEILAGAHTPLQGYELALDFSAADHEQVRTLGIAMMRALAPNSDAARGFLTGARDAAKLLDAPASGPSKPPAPDYSAIGEVIKMWLRESRLAGRRAR
jgi:hypothetical protein